jgi:hypothetical protein
MDERELRLADAGGNDPVAFRNGSFLDGTIHYTVGQGSLMGPRERGG